MQEQLKSNFHSYLTRLKIIDENVRQLYEEAEFYRHGILGKKATTPELTFQDVKQEMLRMHDVTIDASLKSQESVHYANLVAEYYTLAKTCGVDLEVEEDDKKVIEERIIPGTRRLFVISEKDRTVGIADADAYAELTTPAKNYILTDDKLKEMFDSPALTVPPKPDHPETSKS